MTETTETETETTPMNPAVSFLITPKRVGRHLDVEAWEEDLPEHFRSTADYLANRIYKHVKSFLMSDDFVVSVDMRKSTWRIDGGRFGSGTFSEKVN